MRSWRFFILAGGYGTRARPLSSVRAKPAFPLAGVPLIRRMTDQMAAGELSLPRGWVNLHHLPETIRTVLNSAMPIKLVTEPVLTGSRVLTQALQDPDWSHLLVVNGDLFCRLPLKCLASELKDRDGLLLLRSPEADAQYRPLEVHQGRFVRRIAPGRPGPMFTGVSVLSRRAVSVIRSDNFFDDFERENLNIGTCFHPGLWLDFGAPRIYHQANLRFLDHENLPQSALWDPTAKIMGDPASVRRTILWPGARILQGTALQDCVVCDGVVPDVGEWREGVWTREGFSPF